MFLSAAWHTAKTRSGSDAKKDKTHMEEHYQAVVKIGEVTEELASNLKWMGWDAAWYAANKMIGHDDDAKRDKAHLEFLFQKICGNVTLVEMNFFT